MEPAASELVLIGVHEKYVYDCVLSKQGAAPLHRSKSVCF